MSVIRFPSRRARPIEVVHPTTPRVGIFVKAQHARSTGPQAHQTPYIADEEMGVRRQVFRALIVLSVILLSSYCSLRVCLAVWDFVRTIL